MEEYAAALADPENPAQNTAAEEAQVAGLKAVVHERPEGRRAVKTPGYLTQDYVNK